MTLKGRIYLIKAGVGSPEIGIVLSNNRKITCSCSPDLEDSIKEFSPDSLVEVVGEATSDPGGHIDHISLVDITSISLAPLYLSRITLDHKIYQLSEKIALKFDMHDDLYTYEYEPLRILAYGNTRREP